MKTIEIECMIAMYYPETSQAYAQIINTAVNCISLNDLQKGTEQLKHDTDAHDHFDWGFGKKHFWLKQRIGYKAPEVFDNRILIVRF